MSAFDISSETVSWCRSLNNNNSNRKNTNSSRLQDSVIDDFKKFLFLKQSAVVEG